MEHELALVHMVENLKIADRSLKLVFSAQTDQSNFFLIVFCLTVMAFQVLESEFGELFRISRLDIEDQFEYFVSQAAFLHDTHADIQDVLHEFFAASCRFAVLSFLVHACPQNYSAKNMMPPMRCI